jgi:hypothetical protein
MLGRASAEPNGREREKAATAKIVAAQIEATLVESINAGMPPAAPIRATLARPPAKKKSKRRLALKICTIRFALVRHPKQVL